MKGICRNKGLRMNTRTLLHIVYTRTLFYQRSCQSYISRELESGVCGIRHECTLILCHVKLICFIQETFTLPLIERVCGQVFPGKHKIISKLMLTCLSYFSVHYMFQVTYFTTKFSHFTILKHNLTLLVRRNLIYYTCRTSTIY